jgi:uncharacterized protein (DUF305 family)
MNEIIQTTRRFLGFGLLGWSLAARSLAADPAPVEAQARFEANFLADLIAHHQAAVAMAGLAEERAERAELKGFASLVGAGHAKEIETMQGWLEEWYGETTADDEEGVLDRKVQRQIDALAELEGDEFDEALLKALSLHHADALTLARDGLLSAYHSELVDLCRELSEAQSDEIALMRGWLMEWHEVDEVTSRDRPDNRQWNRENRREQAAVPDPIVEPRPDEP